MNKKSVIENLASQIGSGVLPLASWPRAPVHMSDFKIPNP